MTDPKSELCSLYLAEYGDLTDIVMRLLGITVGGVLLYFYTGWAASYYWGLIFCTAHMAQYSFLKSRLENPTVLDTRVGGALFVAVYLSFMWLPARLAAQPDISLVLVGLLVFVAASMYHLRRADTQRWLVFAQILIYWCTLIYISGSHFVRAEDVFIRAGILMVTTMAALYICLTLLWAHKKQVTLIETNARLLQEQKMSAIGQLAGGVAHDFNNILTVIKGNLELCHLVDDPNERRRFLRDALAAAKRAEGVVQQLLVYSRKSPTTRKRVCATSLIEDVAVLGKTIVPERIEFTIQRHSAGAWVDMDERQMTAALLNLIKNAIDAVETNGSIQIAFEVLELTQGLTTSGGNTLPPGPYATYRVSDTGHGIPEHLIPRIQDPFFTTKDVGKGTGLGLSMVAGFVESMDGGMSVKSSPNGTEIRLFFPAQPEPIKAMENTPDTRSNALATS